MAKSISCHDAGKNCDWSANAPTEAELMVKIEEHVKAEHKEIELSPENIANIKTLIKEI
ncbi:DUF1059 domain-containing protein [Candidatus Nitrosopelagicus sp.]|nr:DUF1059 domain-containing protein [Candidatus Nitrosopelagicus sp.]